ncbi:hypothetical protein C2G38_2190334 [Gigaspora rosea]|uniref:Serine-threonine/tyrosine-protein kinase catalytic domain-containing protein n=1 Tax=Gigaspora rosea TaxID=44941 RepID=A0A397V3W9_9GLOM|nr:hypothetical protein C2G38_2190334 [Gigaspora rosea]
MADRHFNRLKKIPYDIIFHASKGEREIFIEGTPNSYIQLYKRCWNYCPNQRPELEEISRKLIDLSENENLVCTSNFDEFISDTTPKISISDIQLSTDSNNDYEKFLFMDYFVEITTSIAWFENSGNYYFDPNRTSHLCYRLIEMVKKDENLKEKLYKLFLYDLLKTN